MIPGWPFPVGLDALVDIDLVTGAASQVGVADFYTWATGLGIDSAGNAWMKTSQSGTTDSMWKIDLATGAHVPFSIQVLEPSPGPLIANMLAFDEDDVLYSGMRSGPAGSGDFTLFTVNFGAPWPNWPHGSVTSIGSNNLGFISGIAFQSDPDPVPEPASLILVAMGGVAIRWRRRRAAR